MKKSPIEKRRRYLNKAITILRYFGILTYDSSASMHRKFLNNFIRIFTVIIGVICVSTMIVDLIVNFNDLMVFADNGCFITGWFMSFTKQQIAYSKRHQIYQLINDIHNPVDVLSQSSDLEMLVNVKECMLFEAIDCYLAISFVLLMIIAINIFPAIVGLLPCRAIYPFDTTTSPYYQIVFFIQAYTIAYNLVNIIALEFISYQLIRYTTLQLRVLSFNYKNCKGDSKKMLSFDSTRKTIDAIKIHNLFDIEDKQKEITSFVAFEDKEINNIENSFNWRFKTCINHHQRLIRIVKDLNDTFQTSLMVQLGMSLLIICFNGYLAAMFPHDKKSLIRYIIYLLSGSLQLLYWCAFGNQLKFEADHLTTGQWMCGWENNYDSGIKNLVTTAMIKTMQPLEIRAGGLFVLNMETFISILKSSYSVFILLTTVAD
ncbi:odorant receptor 83a-like [Microplitis mediator]|uniref:odorant receptor 83a-like n=1 Tax=Microplitis mediator TaxID=375433 RepID=UPI00255769A4|nr:odorant receptor 83a-like [Microplitis mediator]